ncbi:MAG: hypothetical protein RSD28_09565 [Lachnospiraceae bacterium]
MGLFRRKKKPDKIEEIESIELASLAKPSNSGKKETQHIALEYCEQIMNAAKDLEEIKKEYRIVTDYLTDIQKLEDLPEQEKKHLLETASNVSTLNDTREQYRNKARKISEVQFAQMEQLEEDMPDAIKRLKTNEVYQTAVKRDMQYLEGEKGEWIYYQEERQKEQIMLRRILYASLVLFGIGSITLVVLSQILNFEWKTPLFFVLLAVAALGGIIILRMQNDEIEVKKSQANINRAITLCNKVKLKYVTITNAVDYACEKFHVKNSYELNYIWEQYLEEVKAREKYEKTNEDLEYFNARLIRELSSYHMYDPRIWIHQVHALLDKKEMVEVKHELLIRRKKLRTRMEYQISNIQNAKTQINGMMKNYREQENEIRGILDSLDHMCGI